MREKLHQITAFAKYYWRAKTKYDVHSPFVFDFIQNVLEEPKWYYTFDDIQKIRYQLLDSKDSVAVTDFGAGSQVISTKTRKVKDIAASSLSHPFFCQVLFSMINWLSPKNVLELGTSLGVATLHLAKANSQTKVTTLEGCPNIAQLAQQNMDSLGAKNVEIVVGDFEKTLLPALQKLGEIQLIILDGNHQKEATLRYFEQILVYATPETCFIFDDIYWSQGMTEAWEIIKKHPRVTLSIDLFQYGLVFLRTEQQEIEHFTLIPAYCKPWSMGFF
jgi:predicted O-methyltransferase YrrM